MAGWRVGMVLGNEEYINQVLKVKSNMDSGMFYGIQKGAIQALRIKNDWFEEQNGIYRQRRKRIVELAELLNCTPIDDAVGMFVWAKIPEGTTSEQLTDDILYNKDIFITPGTVFGSQGEGYIRFSLCVPEETIVEAIKRF
jgi:aspartate/methionine/tyrosine aminotransferase